MLYLNDKFTVTIDNYQIIQQLRYIATGQTPLNIKLKNTDSIIKEVKPLTSEVMKQNGHLSEINISENTMEEKYDDLKEKFNKAMEKISVIFYKNFEKSPLKMTSSVKKMVDTLEKIKSPGAFSSAVAIFGLGEYPHLQMVVYCFHFN